jgi:protein TonB
MAYSYSPSDGDLVVYEKGKVVFRMKNQTGVVVPQSNVDTAKRDGISASGPASGPLVASTNSGSTVNSVPSNAPSPDVATNAGTSRGLWLDPAEAEGRLITRIEPDYPAAARAARIGGYVVVEVHVAEDGSVYSVRAVSGDPTLGAAAIRAVRNWRYQPYRIHNHPSQFITDVTLNFAANN